MGLVLLILLGLVFLSLSAGDLSCSVKEEESDPALKEMKYDIGYGEQSFMAYVEPDVRTFYKGGAPAATKVVPKFRGLANKFINMSNKKVKLYWEPQGGGQLELMGSIGPFSTTGTAAHPTHRFVFASPDATKEIYKRFIIDEVPNNIYYYDPYEVDGDPVATEANLQRELSESERDLYEKWRDTLLFNEQYQNFTGRSYLANYLRHQPKHFMWRADYFGQQHWVETRETHFIKMPPGDMLGNAENGEKVLEEGGPRDFGEYRDLDQSTMNLTLTALSVAPRVFEIPNFLSKVEVDHILHIATDMGLKRSTVGDVGGNNLQEKEAHESPLSETRTSSNSWIKRETTPIIDAIYRRAADLMRIDEALLRSRAEHEYPEWPTSNSIAEQLQLVHYNVDEEYTAHHGMVIPGFSMVFPLLRRLISFSLPSIRTRLRVLGKFL